MKRLSFVLAFILILNMALSPLTVSASGMDMVDNEIISIKDGVYFNPLLEKYLDKEALLKEHADSSQGISFFAAYPYCSTLEEAADYMEAQMVKRVKTITFTIPYSLYESNSELFQDIINKAWEYDEEDTGQEGDALYWIWKSWDLSASGTTESLDVTYTITYDTNYEQEEELTRAVNKTLASLDLEGLSDYDKIKKIYTFICDHVDYDYTYERHDAYDAMIEGSAVCEGYALLFYRMCKDIGLSVRLVSGWGNGEAHGWNIVRIGDVYYNVDSTWDGQDAITTYNYFMKNTEDFIGHVRDPKWDTAEYHATYPMTDTSWINSDEFDPAINANNITYYFSGRGDRVSTQANGKPKVLIFYSASCTNSGKTIKSIENSNIDNADFIAVEVMQSGAESIDNFIYTYETNKKVKFAGDAESSTNASVMWKYAYMKGISGTVYFPVIVYIDPQNVVQHVTMRTSSAGAIKANLAYYCGVKENTLTITEHPVSAVVNIGKNASFTVAATGDGLKYQWQYSAPGTQQWSNVAGGTNAKLNVQGSTDKNGYLYRCVITDAYNNQIISNSATLVVTNPIMIMSQPKSVTVQEGVNHEFTVSAIGSNLVYQWQYRTSDAEIWKNSNSNGYNTNTLNVNSVLDRNGYQYRCLITDAEGNQVITNVATLTVKATLAFTTQPEDLTVNEDETAIFKVTTKGENVTYEWQYIKTGDDVWNQVKGETSDSLSVLATLDKDGYRYKCIIKDADGNKRTSRTAYLTVTPKFEITSHPESKTVSENANATFAVNAKGTNVTYQWQYRLNSNAEWKNSGMTGSNTNSITVQGTAARNGYEYRCVVKDGKGNTLTSNAAKLTVNISTAITLHPSNKTVDENGSATFAVKANGSNLKYQWQYKLPNSSEWKNSGMTGSNTNSITVQGTAARNGYQYRCVITDGTGRKLTSNAATLTVNIKVKVAITSQPSGQTVNEGANATFAVKATGEGLKYQWQYRLNANAEWKNSGMTGSNTSSITVQGTTARNGYQYRCVVKDASGNQVVSNGATLTVKAGTTFAITSQPASKEVGLNENATFKVVATGNGLTYQWQYRTSSAAEWKKSGMTGSNTSSITVQGTTARNGYQYRCVVKDANGKQLVSNAATLTVKQGSANAFAITSQPANHTVTEGTKVAFSVAATGEGLKYQWQYRTSATAAWKNSGMTGATTNSITVEATAARNGYQYRCVVFDGTGARIDSNPGSLTVSAGQINKLAITSQPESKTVALNENATYTVVAEGEGLTYQWQYRTSATAEWKVSGMNGAKTNSITVQGTAARNGYQYRCVVKDASGKQVVSQAADLIVK